LLFGKTHSEEARKTMSESKIGKKLSEETKAKLSAAAKGSLKVSPPAKLLHLFIYIYKK